MAAEIKRTVLLVALALGIAFGASASDSLTYTDSRGIIWTYSSDWRNAYKTWHITKCNFITALSGNNLSITVPGEIDGKEVSSIGNYNPSTTGVFYNSDRIGSITLPSCLLRIDCGAFADCTALKTITIPEGVTTINCDAFENCTSLASLTLPSTLRTIATSAFRGCTGLTGLALPDNLESIDSMTFAGCTALTSLHIPAKVSGLSATTFNYSSITTITISPDNPYFTVIDNVIYDKDLTTLLHCPPAQTVAVPTSVREISRAFMNNCTPGTLTIAADNPCFTAIDSKVYDKDLTTLVYWPMSVQMSTAGFAAMPKSVTRIGDYACCQRTCEATNATSYYSGERRLTIPAGITSIGKYAFSNCRIDHLELPEGLGEIDEYAFSDYIMTEWNIPASVTNIGYRAFWDSSRVFHTTTVVIVDNCLLSVGDMIDGGEYEIPDGVRLVAGGACSGNKGLYSVKIPSSVTRICDRAFDNSYHLSSISWPSTPFELGPAVFSGCSRLVDFCLPSQAIVATNWWEGARFQHLDIAAGRTVLPRTGAYDDCLKDVTLPDGLCEITPEALAGNSALGRINIPASVTNIGARAFAGCGGLTNLDVAADNVRYANIGATLCSKDKSTLVYQPCTNTFYRVPGEFTAIAPGAFDGSAIRNLIFTNDAPVVTDESFRGLPSGAMASADERLSGFEPDANGLWHGLYLNTTYDSSIRRTYVDGNTTFHYHILSGNTVGTNAEIYVIDSPTSLSGEIILPAKIGQVPLRVVYQSAFKDRTDITRVTIPEGVIYIASEAFSGCSSLSQLNIPSTVYNVGSSVAAGTALAITNGLYLVDGWVLGSTDDVPNDLVLPKGTKGIANEGFFGRTALTSVTFPSTFQYSLQMAFSNCKALTNFTFKGNAPLDFWPLYYQNPGDNVFTWHNITWVRICVPEGSTGWGVDIPGTWNHNPICYAETDHAQEVLELLEPKTPEEVCMAESFTQLVSVARSSFSFSEWLRDRVPTGSKSLAATLAAAPQPKLDYVFDCALGTFSDKAELEINDLDIASAGLTFRVKDGDTTLAIQRLNAAVSVYAATSPNGLESAANLVTPSFTVNADGTVTLDLPKTDAPSAFYRVVIP